MSKYRIKIFSDFCDSEHCKNVYEDICQVDLLDNYGEDKEIYITNDNDYTHVILWNTAMPQNINVPKQNVVGLAFEPPINLNISTLSTFIKYAEKHISKYLIGSNEGLPADIFIQDYAFISHITPPRMQINKNKHMSIMVSEKMYASGHKYRHQLVQSILKTNLPIDIYGRGCRYYYGDNRLKGEFENNEPYESYNFHICIENNQTPAYVSEKYLNTILYGTTPVYWGATNIDTFFPNITISLSGNLEKDIYLLFDIMYNPTKYKKSISQDEIRPKMNLLKNLDKVFS
jgi:hypothetical protein